MSSKWAEDVKEHQQDLEMLLGLDMESDSNEIIHLNHRFFKTFFPNEDDNFADDIPFDRHSSFDCLKLLGKTLVEL